MKIYILIQILEQKRKGKRTDIHNVITISVVKEPVVEEGHFGVGCRHRICAGGEEPAEDGPARNNVRAENLVGRVDDAHNEAD